MSDARKVDPIEEERFRLEGRMAAPEVFVDGWSQFFLGYPITRIVFHTLVEPPVPGRKEVRRTAAAVTMPTAVAIQLAQMILSGSKSNEALLAQAADQSIAQLKQTLSALNSMPLPPGMTAKEIEPVPEGEKGK